MFSATVFCKAASRLGAAHSGKPKCLKPNLKAVDSSSPKQGVFSFHLLITDHQQKMATRLDICYKWNKGRVSMQVGLVIIYKGENVTEGQEFLPQH